MPNLLLPKPYTIKDVEHSSTAIKHGIDNTLPSYLYEYAQYVGEIILEPVRNYFGPAKINSWYRSPELNELITQNKSSRSYHRWAAAVDIEVQHVPNYELAKFIKENLAFCELILEYPDPDDFNAGWVHVAAVEKSLRRSVRTRLAGGFKRGLLRG